MLSSVCACVKVEAALFLALLLCQSLYTKVTCKAATCFLHNCRSFAMSLMSSQVFPISLISLFTVRRKVFFGRLLLRFHPGVQCRAVFAIESSWWVTCPIRLQRLLSRMVAIGLVIEYEQGSISSWRAVPFNSFVVSMFPMKVKSNQGGFSFLDLILLI